MRGLTFVRGLNTFTALSQWDKSGLRISTISNDRLTKEVDKDLPGMPDVHVVYHTRVNLVLNIESVRKGGGSGEPIMNSYIFS